MSTTIPNQCFGVIRANPTTCHLLHLSPDVATKNLTEGRKYVDVATGE